MEQTTDFISVVAAKPSAIYVHNILYVYLFKHNHILAETSENWG